MAQYQPKCRICGIRINKDLEIEGVDWIKPKNNFYYHKKCYEDWKASTPDNDDEYVAFIYDFISRDLKVSYNFHMVEAQRKKFNKEKMTNKGIFFALKYFYEIKNGKWDKSHGGIGIIPYVYEESCEYWAQKERKNSGILKRIEQQMKEAKERETKAVYKKKKEKKVKVDLSAIAEMEDDE